MYLSVDATFGTLRAVAALAPGTEIIFEYSVLKELVDEETQKMLAVVQTAAQAVPEDNKLRHDEIVLSRMLTMFNPLYDPQPFVGPQHISDLLHQFRIDLYSIASDIRRLKIGLSRSGVDLTHTAILDRHFSRSLVG
jgi:hypothetical protein